MTPLDTIIREKAQAKPLPMADFWDAAMMHPKHGYYVQQKPLGKEGDFITAPEISQVFGAIIGYYFYHQWCAMGKPPTVDILEMGAGRGVLLRDLWQAITPYSDFTAAITIHIIESNVHLKQQQQQLLAPITIQYHDISYIQHLPKRPHFIIANEFFDALPIHQFMYQLYHQNPQWLETHIIYDKATDTLLYDYLPCTHDMLKKYQQFLPKQAPKIGDIIETNPISWAIMDSLARHIANHKGAAFIADYGYNTPQYGDTIQSLYRHQYSDIFTNIGAQDITAHVNFKALHDIGALHHQHISLQTQHQFFSQMGGHILAEKYYKQNHDTTIIKGYNRIVDTEAMGNLFKILTF